MDWSLGRRNSKHLLLRAELAFKDTVYLYYVAVVLDIVSPSPVKQLFTPPHTLLFTAASLQLGHLPRSGALGRIARLHRGAPRGPSQDHVERHPVRPNPSFSVDLTDAFLAQCRIGAHRKVSVEVEPTTNRTDDPFSPASMDTESLETFPSPMLCPARRRSTQPTSRTTSKKAVRRSRRSSPSSTSCTPQSSPTSSASFPPFLLTH